ncbi:MAG TPA: Sua5/YciO/YrdC/YwlC family protein [Thermoleophilaceae bacterium]|nr:Sua5/YciO/YrdC/YwlC family protein [Thermoleophilaceae bacterium]
MTGEPLTPGVTVADATAFERCVAGGGVAIFPADTVYGLAADPEDAVAVGRLNELKRRDPAQPSGVMFFSLRAALAALDGLGPATHAAIERLLPGAVTLVLPNPGRRFPLACGDRPDRIGIRVPDLPGPLASLEIVSRPVLQSSANFHGGMDPRRLEEAPAAIRLAADLVLDGGELPGIASTVVDLSRYEDGRGYEVLREAAVSRDALAERLDS